MSSAIKGAGMFMICSETPYMQVCDVYLDFDNIPYYL